MKTELNQIKVTLCRNKKTGKWLSEQLGANPTTVSKWCTNTTQPNLYTLNRIAQLLDVNLSDLLVDPNKA